MKNIIRHCEVLLCKTVAISALFFSPFAHASDLDNIKATYENTTTYYVDTVTAEDITVKTLKSLSTIDKKVKIANDNKRISLYYNAKVIKSYNKPESNETKPWAELTDNIIKEAKKHSKAIERKDFELFDTMMVEVFKDFDEYTHYYPDLDLYRNRDKENSRRGIYHFGDRMIGDYLYMKVGDFNSYTDDKIKASLKNHKDIKGLVLDLRGNPGGLLSQGIEIVNIFLDEGLIVSTKGKAKTANNIYTSTKGDFFGGKPIAILVDGETASSSEVIASCLQEQGRAVVIGAKTYGKGTVQELLTLPNESIIVLTTAYFYTPSDHKIDKQGITPDICLSTEQAEDGETCAKEPRDGDEDIDIAIEQLKLK